MVCEDLEILAITRPLFDGLYEFHRLTVLGMQYNAQWIG
jgi:hypothetical protein